MKNIFLVTYYLIMALSFIQLASTSVLIIRGQISVYWNFLNIMLIISSIIIFISSFFDKVVRAYAIIMFSIFMVLNSMRDLQNGTLAHSFDSFDGLLFEVALLAMAFLVPVLGLIVGFRALTHPPRNEG